MMLDKTNVIPQVGSRKIRYGPFKQTSIFPSLCNVILFTVMSIFRKVKWSGDLQGSHLFMHMSSSILSAMRVCQPRGRIRTYRATMGGLSRFWTVEVRSAFP